MFETLGLFASTLTADDKYCLGNSDNLRQPVQIHVSKNQKKFSTLFAPLLKSTSNFENFEMKYHPHNLSISKITDCQSRGRINV